VSESPDRELFDLFERELYVSVVSDILDSLGYREQALDATLRPIYPGAVVIGRAHTVLSHDVYEAPASPYNAEIAAIDSLKPGDVLVASTGRSTRTCFWGDLLSTASRARGARGAIIDGHVRDVRRIEQMQFPVFATGFRPIDSYGRGAVLGHGMPINCGGVIVNPGDIIFGDVDGIVAIPRQIADEVVERARAKVSGENKTRADLERGEYLRDVFARYGVL